MTTIFRLVKCAFVFRLVYSVPSSDLGVMGSSSGCFGTLLSLSSYLDILDSLSDIGTLCLSSELETMGSSSCLCTHLYSD